MNHATMHFMGNQSAAFHRADAASMETYDNAHHVHVGPEGEEEVDHLVGFRDLDEVIHVDGRWKVRKRVMVVVWQQDSPVSDPAANRSASRSGQ
jgi:hypothetical protein